MTKYCVFIPLCSDLTMLTLNMMKQRVLIANFER